MNLLHLLCHISQTGAQILLQKGAFPQAHRPECTEGFRQPSGDQRPVFLHVFRNRLTHFEHVPQPHQHTHVHRARHPEPVLQLPQCLIVLLSQGKIRRHRTGRIAAVIWRNADVDPAAGKILADQLLHTRFQGGVDARVVPCNIQVAVVDRSRLNRQRQAIIAHGAVAVSGHALHG